MPKKLFIFLTIIFVIITLIIVIKLTNYPLVNERENPPSSQNNPEYKIIAENLQVPWEIVFLPGGDLLVSERSGSLKRIGKENLTVVIEKVEVIGEGGLLGLALHPDFIQNHQLYLYFTARKNGRLINNVVRYRFENNLLSEEQVVLDGIPASQNHNGGRIAFGPDGHLYITTGDAQNSSLAQNLESLAGKILRIRDNGSIPEDNPYKSPVFSYGHRNVQGLAWDDKGRLWATEHGRSGILSGYDELNLVEKGKNYGWPEIQGGQAATDMASPVIQSGADTTWAPAGSAFYKDSVFFAGLRGEALYQAKIISGTQVELKPHFIKQFGRLRAVVLGPDNFIYFSTSNTDSRGKPQSGDDKIVKIDPDYFYQ